MYYKRDGSHEWKGPGKVIGTDNQTDLIKHGSIHVRVHPCIHHSPITLMISAFRLFLLTIRRTVLLHLSLNLMMKLDLKTKNATECTFSRIKFTRGLARVT